MSALNNAESDEAMYSLVREGSLIVNLVPTNSLSGVSYVGVVCRVLPHTHSFYVYWYDTGDVGSLYNRGDMFSVLLY